MTSKEYLAILTPEQRAAVEKLKPEQIEALAARCPVTRSQRAAARREYEHEEE